jgi:hypothetical protein
MFRNTPNPSSPVTAGKKELQGRYRPNDLGLEHRFPGIRLFSATGGSVSMRRSVLLCISLIITTLIPAGCSKPVLEGPQITRAPAGFVLDINLEGGSLPLEDRPKIDQIGYLSVGHDYTHASIMITQYDGLTTDYQATKAYEASRAQHVYMEYGKLESLVVDRQPAWAWLVTQRLRGEVSSLTYVTVVSHEEDGATYVVEFYSSRPQFRDEALMKEVVGSFRVKRAGLNMGQLVFAMVLGVGFTVAYRRIQKEKK